MATTKNKRLCPAPWVAAAAQVAGNAVSSGIQALTQPSLRQQRESKQKYDAWYQENITEKNMSLQNDYQIAAENRQHEYDSPAAQAKRLRAGGYSPLALDGGAGAGVQGSVSPAPSPTGGGSFTPHPMSIRPDFSGVADTLLKEQQQTKLLQSQKDLLDAQAYREYKDAGLSDEQAKDIVFRRENLYPLEIQNWRFRNATEEQKAIQLRINNLIDKLRADTSEEERTLYLGKLKAEKEKLESDKKFVDKNRAYIESLTDTENYLRQPRKENIEQHTKESEAKTKNLDALTETEKERYNLVKEEARKVGAEVGLTDAQTDKLILDWVQRYTRTDSPASLYALIYNVASAVDEDSDSGSLAYQKHISDAKFEERRKKVFNRMVARKKK